MSESNPQEEMRQRTLDTDQQRFQLEQAKAEFEMNSVIAANKLDQVRLDLDRERLELEKTKSKSENKFLNRNSGAIITALVSLAAVLVSLGQVGASWVSKKLELQTIEKQKDKE